MAGAESAPLLAENVFPPAVRADRWKGFLKVSTHWGAYLSSANGSTGALRSAEDGRCELSWNDDCEFVTLSQTFKLPAVLEDHNLSLTIESEAGFDWFNVMLPPQLRPAPVANADVIVAQFDDPIIRSVGGLSVYSAQCFVDPNYGGADLKLLLRFARRGRSAIIRSVDLRMIGDVAQVATADARPGPRAGGDAPVSAKTVGGLDPRELKGLIEDIGDIYSRQVSELLHLVLSSRTASGEQAAKDESEIAETAKLVRLFESQYRSWQKEMLGLRLDLARVQRELDERLGK